MLICSIFNIDIFFYKNLKGHTVLCTEEAAALCIYIVAEPHHYFWCVNSFGQIHILLSTLFRWKTELPV
jgi:hypothetical protein